MHDVRLFTVHFLAGIEHTQPIQIHQYESRLCILKLFGIIFPLIGAITHVISIRKLIGHSPSFLSRRISHHFQLLLLLIILIFIVKTHCQIITFKTELHANYPSLSFFRTHQWLQRRYIIILYKSPMILLFDYSIQYHNHPVY